MFDCIVNRWKPARELFAELNVFLENADILSSSFGNALCLRTLRCAHTHSFLLFIIKTV